MSEETKRRAEAALSFEHKRGPAVFFMRAAPVVESHFRLKNTAPGLETDQQAFDIICEGVAGWSGVPLSWLTLQDSDEATPLAYTPEDCRLLLKHRIDLMEEIAGSLTAFQMARAAKIGTERKNLERTSSPSPTAGA